MEQEILKKKTQGESSPNHEGENVSKNVRNNGNEDFSNLHGQQEKENKKYTNKQKELAERLKMVLIFTCSVIISFVFASCCHKYKITLINFIDKFK